MSEQPKVPQDVADTVGFVLGEHLEISLGLAKAILSARSVFRTPSLPESPPTPTGCYEASFGWVHVRPGCCCPRRTTARK